MKTLNHVLRTILLIIALFSTATNALAYDFVVDGIYYNYNGGDEVTVTYKSKTGHNDGYTYYYTYSNDNIGDVTIPETVTYNGNTYTITAIGQYAFSNYDGQYIITNISIPNTVTLIDDNAFYGCSGLTELVIPESVISIRNNAFRYCSGLSNIVIPDSVISIGSFAFNGCGLSTIVIGKSVSSMDQGAIGGAGIVTCLAEIPPTISNTNCFSFYGAPLYVPMASIEAYRTTYGWNYFTDVRGFGENYFSMPDFTTLHGDTVVIPVSLENEDEITAFQTDIYLPEGFELVQDGNDYMITLSDRKGRDHVIMASEMPDGAVRVLCYSPTLKTFKNNEGELFYITVKVPDDGDGNYRFELNNTIVTTIDEDEVHALNAYNNIMVFSYTLGDVNQSGDITVADVVATARYILNQNPEPFVFEAADINGDNKISITDVVKIAHMVLDADYGEPNLQNPRLSCMDGVMNGNTASITLENEQEYTAFQFDLTLPEGMTASDFALTERANALDLIVKDRGNGKIRIMGYSPNIKAIKGNEGALLTFAATGVGDIVVDRIELVTPTGETVNPARFTITRSPVTTVNELEGAKTVDHVDYYNLAGQRVERPESGATLVVTTYTDGTRATTKIIK